MILHEVTATDIRSLQELSKITFYEAFKNDNTEADMQSHLEQHYAADKLLNEIANPESTFYFAKDNEELLGYIKLNTGGAQCEFQDPDGMELERIYAAPNAIGKGVGKYLIESAIAIAKRKAKKYIWLGVFEKNTRAIQFYQKHGFKQFDTHIFYVGSDAQNDWLMKLEL